jgi:Ca2+-binding RTX toxin-like protein
VNTSTTDEQRSSSVTSLQDGGWVVTWTSEHLGANTSNDREIFFQRFDATGQPAGGEQQVSFAGAIREDRPTITTLDNGDFVISWFNNFSGNAQVFGRVFMPDGTPRSAEFTISDPSISNTQAFQSISALSDGGFVVAWQDFRGFNLTYSRAFDADGTARGPQEAVGPEPNNLTIGGNSVVSLEGGGFGVFWENDGSEIIGAFHGRGTDRADIEYMSAAGEFSALGGNDYVQGSSGDDIILGGKGIDTLYGGDGNDRIEAGGGYGSFVSELLYGGNGDDTLIGSNGVDRLEGDAGDDLLRGRGGDDVLNGGGGQDILRGQTGNDVLSGGSGADHLKGGEGDDILQGGANGDRLNGNDGDDRVVGGGGNDKMYGGDGTDDLSGGAGKDTISGGLGDDVMEGGNGADKFVFRETGFGEDIITDFEDGVDRLVVSAGVAASFADVTLTVVGDDVIVSMGGGEVLIRDMAGLLDATDFIF